ncbi:helix-turn-helix domain-containing protein [Persicimonas caeni]|uniref:helix-turn-helix domain-containing protein n=1 Tax=Persicimonas caeni TaxID=2292766 RepID=UPI00143DB3D3|nr:helix-turn-helix domain-containing protein [Persicimonas caeni]
MADFWREVAQVPQLSFDDALTTVVDGLMALMRASHVMLVIQLRVEPGLRRLDGFHPVLSRDFGPDAEARMMITGEWAAHEPRLHEDPVLRRVVEGAGTFRVVRHRADIDAEAWSTAPVRRLLEQLELEDRVNVVVPVDPDVEVSFCIDRPSGEPIFDDADGEVLSQVSRGLVPLATNFVRFHGLMPGQQRLDDDERNLLARLSSPASEADIAASLGVEVAAVEQRAEQVYEKLGVGSRLELMHFWKAADVERSLPLQQPAEREDVSAPKAPHESGPLIPRVRDAIDGALEDGDLSREAVARRLGSSVRALQRGLGEADLTFSGLVEERRQHLAMVLLALPWLTFNEIAERLGYAQVSSFNRAVARWTGSTPSEVREALIDEHRTRRRLIEENS